MKITKQNLLWFLLGLFLLDISYSFYQHSLMPLDGDIAETVVPASWMNKLYNDPFGFKVLSSGEYYPNPNRFFSHWSMAASLKTMPFMLQHIFTPINSIYVSCALIKTIIQILFIFLIAFGISGKKKFFSWENILIPAVIITPLFQSEGYNRFMGVIDQSITYTFFYAFPLALLLIFCLPIYFSLKEADYNFRWRTKFLMVLLAVILPFSSPLIPGIVLISSFLVLIDKGIYFYKQAPSISIIEKLKFVINSIPRFLFFILIFISLLSLYSLFIGTHNSSNYAAIISLQERYLRLPSGLYNLLTQKIGWLVLLAMIGVNAYVIRKNYRNAEGLIIINLLKWIGIFSVIYILLLPLGGFRTYRSNIVRYDTILPITICLIFIYGLSTYFIIKSLSSKNKNLYITLVLIVTVIFTIADIHKSSGNKCEKSGLEEIAKSPEKIVLLKNDCNVLSWEKINEYNKSELNAELLLYWRITKEKKLYYQK